MCVSCQSNSDVINHITEPWHHSLPFHVSQPDSATTTETQQRWAVFDSPHRFSMFSEWTEVARTSIGPGLRHHVNVPLLSRNTIWLNLGHETVAQIKSSRDFDCSVLVFCASEECLGLLKIDNFTWKCILSGRFLIRACPYSSLLASSLMICDICDVDGRSNGMTREKKINLSF